MVGNSEANAVKAKVAILDTTLEQEFLGIRFADWKQSVKVKTVAALLKLENDIAKK